MTKTVIYFSHLPERIRPQGQRRHLAEGVILMESVEADRSAAIKRAASDQMIPIHSIAA